MNTPKHPHYTPKTGRAGSAERRTPFQQGEQPYVYLLHFDRPYKHARHYLGYSVALSARLQAHKQGNGARLIEVITQAGLSFQLVRLWPCATAQEARALERKLKGWHGSAPLCPLCNPHLAIDEDTLTRQGHQRLEWREKQARPRRPMKNG